MVQNWPFGRASDKQKPILHDGFPIAGDPGYAPPDLFYSGLHQNDFERRRACDLYLLGSLIFFHFSRVSARQALILKLQGPPPVVISGNFGNDLPHFQNAFFESLKDLRVEIAKVAGDLTEELVLLAKELCEPDPNKRGHKSTPETVVSQYDLQRYISRLDSSPDELKLG